jgi:uncharacterized membrane protein YkvA (DUF1232 family)
MRILLTILALAYVLCPVDLLPDWLPGLGWIDDISILGILWWYLYRYPKRKYAQERVYQQQGAGSQSGSQREQKGESGPPHDPYQILGISRKASQQEIKQAYKQLAGKYHPDKVAHLGREFQKLAEQRFKEIQEAFEALRIR